jgi:LmbE family N-acetylglucosaminyl deacetylase
MHSRLKLACVVAHPDDETLALGGTIAKYASEGVEVSLILATRGVNDGIEQQDLLGKSHYSCTTSHLH